MANETCPHCGAGCGPRDLRYGCGTLHQSSGIDGRSEGCLKTEASQLRNQLATVTAERDEERENSRILRSSRDEETSIADSWMRKCNELEQQLDELRRRIDEAPVAMATIYSDGSLRHIEKWFPREMDEPQVEQVQFRLVRDDQPEEAVT